MNMSRLLKFHQKYKFKIFPGDTDKLVELLLDGYDHIIDITDEDGTPILDAVVKKNQSETVAFLQSIVAFEVFS